MCPYLLKPGGCPRGTFCPYAHTEEEKKKYVVNFIIIIANQLFVVRQVNNEIKINNMKIIFTNYTLDHLFNGASL